jgi:K+-transporting ATPase ATPase C chain
MMKREMAIALRMTLVTLILTGVAYPVFMTGLAQALFPKTANGSMVTAGGKTVGSALVGQAFSSPAYFEGRPSAAGANGYDASASSGSNLGPTSAKLHDRVTATVDSLLAQNPESSGPVPPELVTASGSGLDPHLSLQATLWQAPRVAASRGIPLEELQRFVGTRLESRDFGLLGEARVNVLLLNVALDAHYGRPSASGG